MLCQTRRKVSWVGWAGIRTTRRPRSSRGVKLCSVTESDSCRCKKFFPRRACPPFQIIGAALEEIRDEMKLSHVDGMHRSLFPSFYTSFIRCEAAFAHIRKLCVWIRYGREQSGWTPSYTNIAPLEDVPRFFKLGCFIRRGRTLVACVASLEI